MILSDAHSHLASYKPEEVPEILKQAKANGVGLILAVGESLESSEVCIRYAQQNNRVYAASAIHPWNAVMPAPKIQERLEGLAKRKGVVAIGEVGLDFARNPNNKDVQKVLLAYQLSLARKLRLPAVVHTREAHADMMAILRKEVSQGLKGIAHGFTGDVRMLKDWLELEFYISIGVRGFVINELTHLTAAAKEIPLNRLLTETDNAAAGELTGPSAVCAVAKKLAQIRGTSPDEIASAATANLKRILKL